MPTYILILVYIAGLITGAGIFHFFFTNYTKH
jgi:hypothetical protein